MSAAQPLAAVFVEAISLGHVAKALAFVPALREAGFKVVVCMPQRRFGWASSSGVDLRDLYVKDSDDAYARLRAGASPYTVEDIREYLSVDERLIGEISPALVVSEFRPTALAVARAKSIPTLALLEATTGPGFDPASSSVPDIYLPTPWFPPGIVSAYLSTSLGRVFVRRQMIANAAPWRAAWRLHGLPTQATFFDFVGDADVCLIDELPGLVEYVRRPEDYHVGPLHFTFEAAEAFHVEPAGARGRRAYISLGTQSSVEASVVEAGCRALLDDDWTLYVSGGDRSAAWSLDHPRLSFLPFVDEDSLLAQVDLIVHPGGVSTAHRAIGQAVPQLLIPAHANQHWLADSLVKRQLGRLLRARQRSPEEWRAAARFLTEDHDVRLATLDWQRQLRQMDPIALSLPHLRRLRTRAQATG